MTRRQLILVACGAVVALGAAWWTSGDGLTAEEQRLVGSWRKQIGSDRRAETLELKADRTFQVSFIGGLKSPILGSGVWCVNAGSVTLDFEPSRIRRRLRPILDRLGISGPSTKADVRWSDFANEGIPARDAEWTRVRGD